jgi:hypothetical protein
MIKHPDISFATRATTLVEVERCGRKIEETNSMHRGEWLVTSLNSLIKPCARSTLDIHRDLGAISTQKVCRASGSTYPIYASAIHTAIRNDCIGQLKLRSQGGDQPQQSLPNVATHVYVCLHACLVPASLTSEDPGAPRQRHAKCASIYPTYPIAEPRMPCAHPITRPFLRPSM